MASKNRHATPWSQAELKRLRALAKKGLSARVAAEMLGRPHPGLRYKAMVEGIRFFSVKQPAGVQSRIQRRRVRSLKRAA